MRILALLLLVPGLLLQPAVAQATSYGDVLAERSSVSFVSRQMGVEVGGRFRTLQASMAFDPAQPEQGRAQLEIDLASIETGAREADEEVVGRPWFNVAAFPRASFVSTAVRALGGNRYEALGRLSIKGRSQDVVAPFTFRSQGDEGVFEGEFVLRRLDFGIGEGMWSDVSVVANEVRVRFQVVARAQP